jgi:hypothetical protein
MFPRRPLLPRRFHGPEASYPAADGAGVVWIGDNTDVRVMRARQAAGPINPRPLVYTGASGAPGAAGTATVVTPSEEDRYVHDVQKNAQKLLKAIDPRFRVSLWRRLEQQSAGDAFWTSANIARWEIASDYESWTLDLDKHVAEWDGRTVVDKAGRFIVAGVAGAFVVNDWAAKTEAFDKQLHEWATKLAHKGVVAVDDVPDDTISRPQSMFGGDSDSSYSPGSIAMSALKPLLIVGGVALAVVVALNVVPPLLAARAAAKASAS